MQLLLLILTSLSLGARLKDKIYYTNPNLIREKDGIVTVNVKGVKKQDDIELLSKELDITDFQLLKEDSSVDNTNFSVIAESQSEFESLQTTQALTEDELSCGTVKAAHETRLYGLLGYALKAIEKKDIKPSLAYLIANSPSKVTFKNIEPDADLQLRLVFFDTTIQKQCDGQYIEIGSALALQFHGITDTACFPNNVVPTDTSKCTDSQSEPDILLNNAKEIYFENGDIQSVKKLLLRFGIVQLDSNQLIIGWETKDDKTYWIVAEPTEPIQESEPNNEDEDEDPAEAPIEYKYSYESIEAEDVSTYTGATIGIIVDVPTEEEEVIITPPADQPKPAEEVKPIDCKANPNDKACSGNCKNNKKMTRSECPCIVGDTRDACDEFDGSVVIRAALNLVVAVILIPVLALFW